MVIVRPDGTVKGEDHGPWWRHQQTGRSVHAARQYRHQPRQTTSVSAAQGADLGLAGTITAMSAPNLPLRAVGNVRVTQGSTYTAFGRKLNIENGFFTFNGPVANPGINILAMRRNQQVEAGVQVTGTVQFPTAKLVSEPNVPDNEKLSWLLFGHGTDQGNNLGQQSTMTTALALLGSASGKRIAQTFGLDEFSVGQSEVGLDRSASGDGVEGDQRVARDRLRTGAAVGEQCDQGDGQPDAVLVGRGLRRHVHRRRTVLHAALRPDSVVMG